MEENEKAFTRARTMVNTTFPGLLPLVMSMDYSFHDEVFIGVNRTGKVFFPHVYVSESDEFLATAMSFSALYCYGFNLFDGYSSIFAPDELLSAVEKNHWAVKLNKPEVRYLKMDGYLTYALKKRATVAALSLSNSNPEPHDSLRDLKVLTEEKILKPILQEEIHAFHSERFHLAHLALEDRVNLLWDIQANQFDFENDYMVPLGFLKRNFQEIHEVGMVVDFISATTKAARHLGKHELNTVKKQLLEPIIKGSKGFNYGK